MAVDWSSMPLDMVTIIAMKLGNIDDFIYFSMVCRAWNHVSSIIKNDWRPMPAVPWLLLAENTKNNPNCIRRIFNLSNKKCYQLSLPEMFGARCWGSAYGWVAIVDRELNVKLFNPITKARIHFPSLKTLPNPPLYDEKHFGNKEEFIDSCIRGFCSKLLVLKMSQHNDQHEFVIMILYDYKRSCAFSRHGDQSWTHVFIKEIIGPEADNNIVDLVAIGNFAFGLHGDGSIVYLNLEETSNFEPVIPMDYAPPVKCEIIDLMRKGPRNMYLVQSGGDLFMVIRYLETVTNPPTNPGDEIDFNYDRVYETSFFQVYKLDSKDKHWEELEDFGDLALFVGDNYSISVYVNEAKYLQRSCIYHTDDHNDLWHLVKRFGGHDMGVYDNINDEWWQFYEGEDTRDSLYCPPIWFTPQF